MLERMGRGSGQEHFRIWDVNNKIPWRCVRDQFRQLFSKGRVVNSTGSTGFFLFSSFCNYLFQRNERHIHLVAVQLSGQRKRKEKKQKKTLLWLPRNVYFIRSKPSDQNPVSTTNQKATHLTVPTSDLLV